MRPFGLPLGLTPMPTPLPPPASTTDVYLAAIVERLDKLLAAIAPAEVPPAPRKRAPKPIGAPRG